MFDFLFHLCIYLQYLLFKNLLYVLSLAVMQQMPRQTPCTSGCLAINQIPIMIQQLLNDQVPLRTSFLFRKPERWLLVPYQHRHHTH